MRRTTTTLATALMLLAPACAKRAPRDSMASAPPMGDVSGAASAGGAMASEIADGDDAPMLRAAREEEEDPSAGYDSSLQAGRLTAGVFDDALNPTTFAAFMHQMAPWNQGIAGFAEPFAQITVVDGDGRPAPGVTVLVRDGGRGKRLMSGTDGRVVVFGDYDARGQSQLEVQVDGRQGTWTAVDSGGKATLRVNRSAPERITALDLALVIDATGSMGDELEYIKVELRSIAAAISRDFPGVDQRYALVVYRDEGDDYVSRSFEFTGNLQALERSLGKQRADGGGDYPEAMDAALLDASELRWRDDPNTARMVFLVADAPPHDNRVGQTMAATDRLRAEGVGIYPVAASGVASEAEAVMRAAAVASGGQYVFLTDDSGVGNSHEEPHIPCYAVESLRDAMARMVHSELAGARVEADPRKAVRTVGQAKNGVCEVLHRAG